MSSVKSIVYFQIFNTAHSVVGGMYCPYNIHIALELHTVVIIMPR